MKHGKCAVHLTKEQCRGVADADKKYTWRGHGSWPHTPAGCFLYTTNGNIYFNTNYNSNGKCGASNYDCFCKIGNDFFLTLTYTSDTLEILRRKYFWTPDFGRTGSLEMAPVRSPLPLFLRNGSKDFSDFF